MNLFSKHETRRRLLKGLPDSDLLPTLVSQWYQTPQGTAVLQAEKDFTSPLIARMFGYHILQVGPNEEVSLIDDSPVGHKIIFAPRWRPGTKQAVANIEELPLATDSIDVVVVHHALDFAEDSHRLLREVTRVLRPGGQMLIIGFNPLSYWGFWRLFKRRIHIPWRGRFISKRRLSDWLQLLNLHINTVDYGLHFLPIKYARLLKQAQNFEKLGLKIRSPLGGAYFIQCVKQVAPITPIVPKWRPLRAPATVIPAAENVRAKIH
ncbi:MAG: methyltransferase domain-containing protein [Gammaproteobacteria bacterium]|nr:methyltransferase domain-containing protein [Gammaproteobacteria bacterium]MDD9960212.1 methyltransferase domain-containing protein [Gammaproteobacteria bacterium]